MNVGRAYGRGIAGIFMVDLFDWWSWVTAIIVLPIVIYGLSLFSDHPWFGAGLCILAWIIMYSSVHIQTNRSLRKEGWTDETFAAARRGAQDLRPDW